MDNPAMTLLASAINLDILDIENEIHKSFCKDVSYTKYKRTSRLRENARDFYRIAHNWLRERGEAALRSIYVSDLDTCEPVDIFERTKLGTAHVFKTELRRLMKQ